MKLDEPINFRNPSLFDLKVNPPKKDSYLEYAKCNQGHPCVTLCISDHCQAEAALCIDQECKCKVNHDNDKICSIGRLSKIVTMTEKKRQSFPEVLQWVIVKYDELVDWISDERERLCQHFKSLGLNEDQKSFLKTVYEGECNKLTGKQVYKIVNDANSESKNLEQMTAQIQQKLQMQWQICVEKIQRELTSFNSSIVKNCLSGAQFKKEISGFKTSKVLSNAAERATVNNMLQKGKRKVLKIELLYRASDSNFDVNEFWQKCNHKADTVTVALTEFDKVIGGYTPLSWKKDKHNNYEEDLQMRSFLFSVTEKTKFTLKYHERDRAIYHHTAYGPCFGNGTDFWIKNNANNTNSAANIGNSYENNKVQTGTKKAWQFFQGSTDNWNFRTQQWEVWQVRFE